MIPLKSRLILTLAAPHIALISYASAASTVFDDFSSGGYPSNGGMNSVSIVTPFADNRLSYGSGSGWSSSVDTFGGVLTYTLNTRVDPGSDYWFDMIYTSSLGNMNLVGYNAFIIHIQNLTGDGQMLAHFGSGTPASSVIPLTLSGTGDLVIPFASMGSTIPDSPSFITFEIIPGSRDFSITLSGISVIPEPSTAALASISTFFIMARRRRIHNTCKPNQ
jgi:hypothetical protein